jgi:flagellar motor switch protein FliN/FliY
VTEQKIRAGAAFAQSQTPPATAKSPAKINTKLIDAVEVVLDGFLGSARMTVAELTALKADALVELDAALNTPVELRLNGVAVARGELVAVGDKFAVRLTEISS